MDRKGFTLVEIMAVVAIIAVISVAAIAGVTSIINRQRIRTATLSETNINEAALSIQSEKHNLYLPACVDKNSGTYVNITETLVKKINDDLRAEMEHEGKTTNEQKEEFIKNYVKSINTNDAFKRNFATDYLKVKDMNCFKATSVADMIKEGYLKDLDDGCDRATLIIIYNKGDSANTAGNLKAVQETGICKGSESEEKGPLITVSPEKDLRSTAKKTVKITATANESNLESNLVLKYGWSKSLRKKPSAWETVDLVGDRTKVSAEVSKTGADEEFYLWIAAGSVKDNKGYSNVTFATGPYSFLPTPTIKYVANNYDESFNHPTKGHNRCNAETTCNDKTKVVVYSKPYGKDVDGYDAPLCEPVCKGYTFNTWKYTDLNINDYSIVGERNNHNLTAIYTVNKYDVMYDSNRGNACSPNKKTVTYDEPYGTLCLPTRTGYTSKGWWTEKTGGSEITSETYVSTDSDHTIHAHWEANPFYVAYDGNGENGGSVATHRCIYDGECTLRNNSFNKTDHTFNGWKKDNAGTALKAGTSIKNVTSVRDATVTYYAQWCHNCVTPSHGTCTLDATTTAGTCTYTTTCNTCYSIGNNARYNPTCTPTNYNITYDLDGGSVSGNPSTYNIETPTFTLNNPTKTNYTFRGWTGSNGSTPSTSVSIATGTCSDKSYTAKWCRNCAATDPATCTMNLSACTYETSCPEGYNINNNGKYNPSCTAKKYNLTYEYNGGTAPSSGVPSSYTYGVGATINGKPTKKDHTFNGWSRYSNLSSPSFSRTIGPTATGDKKYYAKWCENCANVSHGSCSLDANTAGTCSYTTSCDNGYELTAGANTHNPTCTPTYTITIRNNAQDFSGIWLDGKSSATELSKTVIRGTKVEITATPKSYHQFTRWSDGDPTRQRRKVTVNGNMIITPVGRKNRLIAEYYSNGGVLTPGQDQKCAETACGNRNSSEYCKSPYTPLIELSGCTGNKTDFIYTIALDYDSNGYCGAGIKNYARNAGATLYLTRSEFYPTYRWRINSASSGITICENRNGFRTSLDLAKYIDNLFNNTVLQEKLITEDATVKFYAEWSRVSENTCGSGVPNPYCP